ncbi:hypothetical protein [Cupriavidus sp. WS]|uniref:hypothetical protein n=1 Tax=Cupriavidus sp. WS TaxID=1312922 RepID=UPI000363349D|nr:hypothetical protein [Cupriavidus sp. WS]
MLDSSAVLKEFRAFGGTGMPLSTLREALRSAGYDHATIAEAIDAALQERRLMLDSAGMVREGQRLAHFTADHIGLTDLRLSADELAALTSLAAAGMRTPGRYEVSTEVSKQFGITPESLQQLMKASSDLGRHPYPLPLIIKTIGTFTSTWDASRQDPFSFELAVQIID